MTLTLWTSASTKDTNELIKNMSRNVQPALTRRGEDTARPSMRLHDRKLCVALVDAAPVCTRMDRERRLKPATQTGRSVHA